MIETDAVSRVFGPVRAVDNVTLTVKPGEVLCLLGANGAGKTTLVNILMGFVPPTSGRALVDGIDVAVRPADARMRLGYVPEQVGLYEHLSGLEHLRFFTQLAGQQRSDADLLEQLAHAGLSSADARRPVGGYSKGMRQKVALAVALARDVRALVLDEPLSGLDPKAALEFSSRLRELAGAGMAVLLTTHDLWRARETATEVGIMRAGRLVTRVPAGSVDGAALEALYLDIMRD